MPGLGDLIRGAVSGAGDAVERILVQFDADTRSLDAAMAKLDQTIAREEQQHAKALTKARAAKQEALAIEADYNAKSQQLSAARAHAEQMAVRGVTQATDAQVAALQKVVLARANDVQKAQEHERQLYQTSRAIAHHTSQLKADHAALAARAAAGTSGPSGVSAAGAAVIGAGSAIAAQLAMTAIQGLGRAVEQTALAYVEWGHKVSHLSKLMGSSTEEASVMLYTFQRFGLTAADASRVIVQLSRHVADNEDRFKQLGVQTRNANGEFKSAWDIMDQVREVLSQTASGIAKNDDMMKLLMRSSASGALTFAELNTVFGLTKEQVEALRKEAEDLGIVLSEQDADAAHEAKKNMDGLAQAFRGLQIAIGKVALPAVQSIIIELQRFVATVEFATSRWEDFKKVIADRAQGRGGVGDDLERFVQDKLAQNRRIAAVEDEAGRDQPSTVGGKKDHSAADAIRDRIYAIEEEKRQTLEAIREELSEFEKAKQREIDLIQERAKESARAHQEEIADIEEEKRAAQDAFEDKQRGRSDEIAALRERLAVLQEQWRIEDARASLANDEKQLMRDKGRGVFRHKGMHEEDYQKAVFEHNKRILDDEKRVAHEKKVIQRDEVKFKIEEQIKAIEARSTLERRALEDYKKGRDEEIRTIRARMVVEKDASDAAIKATRDQMKVEKDRVEDKIKGIEKETRAIVHGLQLQLKHLDAATDGMKRHKDATDAATASLNAFIAAEQEQARRAGERSRANSDQRAAGERNRGLVGGDDDPNAGVIRVTGDPGQSFAVPGYARGGDMLLTEPVVLSAMRTGRPIAVAGEAGPERVTFGGATGQGNAAGSGTTNHIHLYVGTREVAEVVIDELGRALSRGAAGGYGRKL